MAKTAAKTKTKTRAKNKPVVEQDSAEPQVDPELGYPVDDKGRRIT